MCCLLTDIVEGCGGSARLIKILNRLGICASAYTHSRYIQYGVEKFEKQGVLSSYPRNTFTIASADNLDFIHYYARVYCGNQQSSWHGTTEQVVQPQPLIPLHLPTPLVSDSPSQAPLMPALRDYPGQVSVVMSDVSNPHSQAPPMPALGDHPVRCRLPYPMFPTPLARCLPCPPFVTTPVRSRLPCPMFPTLLARRLPCPPYVTTPVRCRLPCRMFPTPIARRLPCPPFVTTPVRCRLPCQMFPTPLARHRNCLPCPLLSATPVQLQNFIQSV